MKIFRALLAPLFLLISSSAWAQDEAPEAEAKAEASDRAAASAEAAKAYEAAVVARADAAKASEAARAETVLARKEAAKAYQDALRASEKDQREALEAVESALHELETRDSAETEREMEEVQRELERAHESLRRASREVARVHRNINRPVVVSAPHYSVKFAHDDKAVIGVILGESSDNGVPVIGISPDGPAERAGVTQGDVIVSIMGTPLADGDEDPREVLGEVMDSVEVGDELTITVDRDGEQRELMVVPEAREPFTWHSYSRLPSVSTAVSPDGNVIIERIEVPEIDRKALDKDLARLRAELDETRIVVDARRVERFGDHEEEFVYEFDTEGFSGFGDAVISGTNVWFGMPLVRGLKMAEINEGLGEYFKTERGVLVLKAREDNELQLQSGDVILSVGETEVNKPADVMRALRNVESGMELEIGIKRDRKNRKLLVEVPENNRVGFNLMFHDLHE